MKTKKELSLYVHIPFCKCKCRYCDFLSAPASLQKREEYVKNLIASIEDQSAKYSEYEVISIFFGGGTPSLLEAEQIRRILHSLRQNFQVSESAEITIEVNPGTVDFEKWQAYFDMGINRASIGLQSADQEELKLLGRIHTYEEFVTCYQDARKAGFGNLNIDLISSLPGQTVSVYEDTLKKVIALQPEHISAYSLILEENTPLYDMFMDAKGHEKTYWADGKEYQLLTEEEDRELYHLSGKILEQAGYERYEISNYAKKGYECRHNIVYWRRGEYLGLGAGAASLIGNTRFCNEDFFPFAHKDVELLTKEDEMAEWMFLGLRMIQGVSSRIFQELFQIEMEEVYGKEIRKLQTEKLLEVIRQDEKEYWIRLTPLGLDVSNYAMSEFVKV